MSGSVLTFHERLIWLLETAVPMRPVGTDGAVVSSLETVTVALADLAAKKTTQLIVGFAAETENVLENARKKLARKSLDAIVVNDVSREGVGFDSDRNAVTILTPDELVEIPETTKWEVAQRVLDQVVKLRRRARIPAS